MKIFYNIEAKDSDMATLSSYTLTLRHTLTLLHQSSVGCQSSAVLHDKSKSIIMRYNFGAMIL